MSDISTVLVVEDEALVRFDLADHLEDAGYRVLQAANSTEALDILDSDGQVKLIVTDVDMPGAMDGLKLSEKVAERAPDIGIIVVSGHLSLRADTLPGDCRFFAKPYDLGELEAAVHQILRRDAHPAP